VTYGVVRCVLDGSVGLDVRNSAVRRILDGLCAGASAYQAEKQSKEESKFHIILKAYCKYMEKSYI
jgi:hypothetical protein